MTFLETFLARGRTLKPVTILAVLAVVVVVVAVLTPESGGKREGGRSSFSAGSDGVRMMFELAQRMGWRADRRLTPLDSTAKSVAPTVHVVLAPGQALGAHEVHRLLMNVRQGGGLIFALDDGGEIADSLGLATGRPDRFLADYADPACPAPPTFSERSLMAIPPEVHQIVWRRPAPGPTVPLVTTKRRTDGFSVGVGFPMGAGRVAVVSSSAIFTNDALRECRWGADIAAARVLEYVRPANVAHPSLVFDEYHHGFGMHGGSLSAVTGYLVHTSSGRFLAQALIAGLLLVLAKAPRPIVPHDPERIVRRSPLEHAEALGQAYADVGATRTVAARLVSGLRRRVGRIVPGGARLDDRAFLDSVAGRWPDARPSVSVVDRALREPMPPRELAAVGDAVRDIEHHLTTSPPPTTRS
jgi:hypothetical protein